ncbi:hypothetical protein ABLE94_18740 [Gordonia sp. VNK1]|uniref:hypothetical protein n=1 Tax=Gordonia oleivorans TaxID=3156618 RepID=UPI0032B3BE8D
MATRYGTATADRARWSDEVAARRTGVPTMAHRSSHRSIGEYRLPTTALIAATVVVGICAFAVPAAMVAGGDLAPGRAAASTTTAVAEYWHSGQSAPTPELAHMVAQWQHFHAAKAVLAVALLALSLMLSVRLYRRWRSHSPSRWSAVGAGGAALTASLATVVLVANIQGTLAPLSSVLSFLPSGNGAVRPVGDALGGYPASGDAHPALTVLVDDFARYHVVVAVAAALLTVVLLAVGAYLIRRSSTASRSSRLRRTAAVTACLLGAAAWGLLSAANLSSALHPAAALTGFFVGG